MKKINLDCFSCNNVKSEGNGKYIFPTRGGFLSSVGNKGEICGYKAENGKFLAIDVTNHSDYSCGLILGFSTTTDNNWGEISFKFGILPQLRTRFVLPLSALDGKILFLERTPGRLKCVTQGRPLKLDKICKVTLNGSLAFDDTLIEIHDMFIADEEPDYSVETKAMVDKLGQKKNITWDGKTESEADLIAYLQSEAVKETTVVSADWSKYGGWMKKRFEPTGYFGIENDGERWWLKDPDGYAFFSTGLDCVRVDGDCNMNGITQLCEELPDKSNPGWNDRMNRTQFSWHASNLYKAFGDEWFTKWADITNRRMSEWGFNTIACWSDGDYTDYVKKPYVQILGHYPHTQKMIFRDFPDVFSDEFKDSAENWAKSLEKIAEDKNLIGYFMSNEPMWAFVNNANPAAMLLESDVDYVSKRYLIDFLKDKYQTVTAINNAWDKSFASFDDLNTVMDTSEFNDTAIADLFEFSTEMIHEYIKVPALAAKKYDPNHLNLGIRYAWLSSKMLASGSEYIDVYSFNCYSMDPTDSIINTIALIDKPVMIGEFHFGALDKGMDATGLRGVLNQEERGKAFRYYMHKAAVHPSCVGAHYFTLNDQGYLGRFDGENYQIGLVDVCNRPYTDFIDGVITTNRELYDVADGNIPPVTEMAVETPAIAF